MTPEQLADLVRGCLPPTAGAGAHVDVLRRRGPGPGTWTTPVAVRLAAPGEDPEAVAAALAPGLRQHPGLADVQVLDGGHLALTPTPASATATALAVGRAAPTPAPPAGPEADDVPDDLAALRVRLLDRCRARLLAARPASGRAPAGVVGGVRLVPRPRVAPTGPQVVHRLGSDAVVHAVLRVRPAATAELGPRAVDAVRRVQHAHARAARAVRAGAALRRPEPVGAPLDGPGEPRLLAAVADHARVVTAAAASGDPHHLVRHLDDVAALAHRWMDATPWPGGDPAAAQAGDEDASRLGLARSVRAVLGEGLGLLGATAPERT